MTPEELKALVAAKIAGQGTNVDAGGGLPEILNGIIDLVAGQQLPIASAEQLGGVKVGSGLDITPEGVLSAGGGGGNEPLIVNGVADAAASTITVSSDDLAKIGNAYNEGNNVIIDCDDTSLYTVVAYNNPNYLCIVPQRSGPLFFRVVAG